MEHSQFFIGLRKLFERFPGIGPRQANRFIWSLLDFEQEEQKFLGESILALSSRMRRCDVCFRVFPVNDNEQTCSFCAPQSQRDNTILMVVERDSDLLNIEKAFIFKGIYHVLGGVFDPLQEASVVRDRIRALYERISKTPAIKELVFALSPTKMGEFTAQYIQKVLEPLMSTNNKKIKITRLGRGLATGMELEYADEFTLKQALDNRR